MKAGSPKRRHPDCPDHDCRICLEDHEALNAFLAHRIGLRDDWLRRYRAWLEREGIPAEANGWASAQAFDTKNVAVFIDELLSPCPSEK